MKKTDKDFFPNLNKSLIRSSNEKEKTFNKIKQSVDLHTHKRKYPFIPIAAVGLSFIIVLIISFSYFENKLIPNNTDNNIVDLITEEKLSDVDVTEGMHILLYENDNMERGDNPYHFLSRKIVVDLGFNDASEVRRGDILFYHLPESFYGTYTRNTINRVIALPGETVEIKEGQFYIDGKKLDTFYGNAMNNVRSLPESVHNEMEAIKVSADHVFLSGDLWWRSIDSKQYGPVPLEYIEGKVIGYQ